MQITTVQTEKNWIRIPIVASSTTPYREFVRDGVTGFLVEPGGDWEGPIRELINNEGLRVEMGMAARNLAAEYTTEKLAARLWAPILFGEDA